MLPTRHLLAFAVTAAVLIAVSGLSVLFAVSALVLGRRGGLATVVGNAEGTIGIGGRLLLTGQHDSP